MEAQRVDKEYGENYERMYLAEQEYLRQVYMRRISRAENAKEEVGRTVARDVADEPRFELADRSPELLQRDLATQMLIMHQQDPAHTAPGVLADVGVAPGAFLEPGD